MVRQYVGARYVPKFSDINGGEWDNTYSYEPLTIVKYGLDYYTSKIPVPVGASISDTTYWVKTGDYNGAISTLDGRVSELEDHVDGMYIYVKDYDDQPNPIQAAIDYAVSLMTDGASAPIIVISKDYTVDNISLQLGIRIYATKNITLTQPAAASGSFLKIGCNAITTSVLTSEDSRKMGKIFMGGRVILIKEGSPQVSSSVGVEFDGTGDNAGYHTSCFTFNNVSIYNFGTGILNTQKHLYIYNVEDCYIAECLTAIKYSDTPVDSGENVVLTRVIIDHCARCIHIAGVVHLLTCHDCSFDYNGCVFYNEARTIRVNYENGWIEAIGGGTSKYPVECQSWAGFGYLVYESTNAISPSETGSNIYNFNGTYLNYSSGNQLLNVSNAGSMPDGDESKRPECIINFNTSAINGPGSRPTNYQQMSIGLRKNIEVNMIKPNDNGGVGRGTVANICRNVFTATGQSVGDSVSNSDLEAMGITLSRSDCTITVQNDKPAGVGRGLRFVVPSAGNLTLKVKVRKGSKYHYIVGFSSDIDGYTKAVSHANNHIIHSTTYGVKDVISSINWIQGEDVGGTPYDKYIEITFVNPGSSSFTVDIYNLNIDYYEI